MVPLHMRSRCEGGFCKRANLREKYLPRAENKLSSLGLFEHVKDYGASWHCPNPNLRRLRYQFILNLESLENLESRPFLRKAWENLDSQGILYNFYSGRRQVRAKNVFSQHVIFKNYWHGC